MICLQMATTINGFHPSAHQILIERGNRFKYSLVLTNTTAPSLFISSFKNLKHVFYVSHLQKNISVAGCLVVEFRIFELFRRRLDRYRSGVAAIQYYPWRHPRGW